MKNLFLLMTAVMALTLTSCLRAMLPEPTLEDGIYVGKFNEFAIAYKVESTYIVPVDEFFCYNKETTIDEKSFVVTFSDDYFPKSVVCIKTLLRANDYETATLNSDKEFIGLHYALNVNDISYNGGLLFAIKSLPSGKMLITITRLNHPFIYQTEGIITMENSPKPHRKLTFTVTPEITNQGTEEWTMNINSTSSYQWSGLFDINTNNHFRFQVYVVDNGVK